MRRIAVLTAMVLFVAPHASAQDLGGPKIPDLMPPRGACVHEDNPYAHHRLQRLAMHCLLDEVRLAAGLSELEASVHLRHSAIYKARRIADCRTFSHFPCGDQFAYAFRRAGVSRDGRWLVGENLGWAVAEKSTPRRVLANWLGSPTHLAVITDDRFEYVGIRRRRLRMHGAPAGAVIWVAHLGVPRGR